jgi:hypothetical protein
VGLISAETLAELEARRLLYILGGERTDKLCESSCSMIRRHSWPLTMKERGKEADYEAKTVMLARRHYIVCRNHAEAEKDAADRASIVPALERQFAICDKLDETIRGHVFVSRAGAQKGAGGPHRGARSLGFLARDHRRSGFVDRNRDQARQVLRGALCPASRHQPRPARNPASRCRQTMREAAAVRRDADYYCRSIAW